MQHLTLGRTYTDNFLNFNGNIGFNMLCDSYRNMFYESLIKKNVKDKVIVDPTWGTGFLSFLALKHGAKEIIAFEYQKPLYEIGLTTIKKLNFQNKIKLFHKWFDFNSVDLPNDVIILHELIGHNIYNEKMKDVLSNNQKNIKIIPGQMSTQIWIATLDDFEFLNLKNKYNELFLYEYTKKYKNFNTHVDIGNNDYNEHISNIIEKHIDYSSNYFLNLNLLEKNFFKSFKDSFDNKLNLFSSGTLDFNKMNYTYSDSKVTKSKDFTKIPEKIILPLPKKENYFLKIKFFYGHDDDFQCTETPSTHWDLNPCYVINKNLKYNFLEQDLNNGKLIFL